MGIYSSMGLNVEIKNSDRWHTFQTCKLDLK